MRRKTLTRHNFLLCFFTSLCLCVLSFASGCVPATVPPHLANTPGAPVVVADRLYDAGAFRAEVPDGWRVITSPADEATFVLFVSPGNCALIVLSVAPVEMPSPSSECDATAFATERREQALERVTVYAGMNAPTAARAAWLATFERVVSSIQ